VRPAATLSLAELFTTAAARLEADPVPLGTLLEGIGERGYLLGCVLLAIPLLFPIGIPGTSPAYALLVLSAGIAACANRAPWLPESVRRRCLARATCAALLNRAARLARRWQWLLRPRWLALTDAATVNRINGAVLILLALLFWAPLPLVPLANTLPAGAVLLLGLGMAERDGACVALGWIASALATAYIAVLIGAEWSLGQALLLKIGGAR
jgi:hypothetical protein